MNPWAIVGFLVVLLGSNIATGWWQNGAGHTEERAVWLDKDNQEITLANAKIIALEQAARDKEQKHGEELQQVAITLERNRSDELEKRDNTIARLRAGDLRLLDPHAAGARPAGDPAGQVATGPGQRDGAAAGELSGAAAEFLVSEASRADAIVNQLTACQDVLRKDREFCR